MFSALEEIENEELDDDVGSYLENSAEASIAGEGIRIAVGNINKATSTIMESITELNNLDKLTNILSNSNSRLSNTSSKLLQVSIESISNKLGVTHYRVVSIESYSNSNLALEGIWDFFKAIWEAIVKMFTHVVNFFTNLFSKIKSFFTSTEKKIPVVKKAKEDEIKKAAENGQSVVDKTDPEPDSSSDNNSSNNNQKPIQEPISENEVKVLIYEQYHQLTSDVSNGKYLKELQQFIYNTNIEDVNKIAQFTQNVHKDVFDIYNYIEKSEIKSLDENDNDVLNINSLNNKITEIVQKMISDRDEEKYGLNIKIINNTKDSDKPNVDTQFKKLKTDKLKKIEIPATQQLKLTLDALNKVMENNKHISKFVVEYNNKMKDFLSKIKKFYYSKKSNDDSVNSNIKELKRILYETQKTTLFTYSILSKLGSNYTSAHTYVVEILMSKHC